MPDSPRAKGDDSPSSWLGRIGARVKKSGERLPETVLTGARQGGRFDPPRGRVAFERAICQRVDYRGTSWGLFWASESSFVDCDFRDAHLSALGLRSTMGAYEGRTLFTGCRFDGADLGDIDLGAARFERCRFDGARIDHWFAFTAEFVDCHFAGRIMGSTFSGRPWGPGAEALRPRRSRNEFSGNDFREVDLIDCSFVRNVDLRLQFWPTGNDYVRFDRARDRIARARIDVGEWTSKPDREAGRVMLDVYSTAGYEDQEEIITRRYDLVPTISRAVTDRVWALIERR